MSNKLFFGSVIRNPGFINLWTNQILVQLAYNSLNFALIIWTFRLTNSNFAVSALLIAVSLPAVLFGLFSGVLVDSLDRKKIIIGIDFLLALAIFSLTFTKNSYLIVLISTFIINTLAQFYTPTEASIIPDIVKRDQLLQANSLFSSTLFTSFLLGFGLAGPIISFFGINFVFYFGTSVLTLAFLLALKFPKVGSKQDAASKQVLKALKKRQFQELKQISNLEIKDTLRLVRIKLPLGASILILSGVQAVIGVLGVLIPSFLERVLQISATDASYVLIAPLGVGMILGALMIGHIGHRFPRRGLVGRSVLALGLLFFIVGIAPLIVPVIKYFPKPEPLPFFHQPSLSTIMAIGSFLAGMAMVAVVIPSQTVLQENTPASDRGKVFAVLGTMMAAFTLVPVLFAGILADLFGTMPIFIALGGSIALIGLFMLKPDFFFEEAHLPDHIREFLGLGHWKK